MAGKLIHEVLPVGLLQCNCSILGDAATGDAIVVDPGDEVERILEIIRRHNLKVRAIVSTHTHIDHVGGLATLHKATGAPVMVHEADLPLYANLEMQAEWLGVPTPAMMRIRDFVKEGDTVRWGGFAARVLHTPGHTPGSISLLIEPGTAAGGERRRCARIAPHFEPGESAEMMRGVRGAFLPATLYFMAASGAPICPADPFLRSSAPSAKSSWCCRRTWLYFRGMAK